MKNVKKILAVVLAVTILTLVASVTAFAETTVNGDGLYGASAESEVYYHKYSEYTVTVPSTITCNQPEQITVDGYNVEDGYVVAGFITNADANGKIELTSGTGETAYASLQFDYSDFTPGDAGLSYGLFHTYTDFDSVTQQTSNVNAYVMNQPEKAGQYSGMLCYRFDCVPSNYFN